MKFRCGKMIAGCFALSAFAVAIVAGLAADAPAAQVLLRAVVAMIVCYPAGLAVGLVCQGVISAHIESHIKANPVQDTAAPHAVGAAVAPPDPDERPIVV